MNTRLSSAFLLGVAILMASSVLSEFDMRFTFKSFQPFFTSPGYGKYYKKPKRSNEDPKFG